MPRSLLLIAPLAALLLVAGALLIGGGGGPSSVAPPTSSAVPSAAIASATATSTGASPSPTASPTPYPLVDGEAWIAVESDQGILLIQPDGSGTHTILSTMPDRPTTLGWSPDGQRLAYEGNSYRGSQIWIADADGTGAQQLVPTPDGCPLDTCIEGVQPAWSPDGRSIAFIAPTHVGGTFKETALMTVDVATGATTTVYTTATTTLARPTWSPVGRSIALEVQRYPASVEIGTPSETAIGIIDLDATNPTPTEITEAGIAAGYPFWHPTDDLLVFRTNRFDSEARTLMDPTAPSDLYTIRPDGSKLTQITHNEVGGAIVRGPSWTPDGERIVFGKLEDPNADEELRIIDVSGANEASATGDAVTIGEGRWRPGT